MSTFSKSLFIFRRDLRLDDNSALNLALQYSKEVYPVFFLDPRQLSNNEYYSANAAQFMRNSLLELAKELEVNGGKLNVFQGKVEEHLKLIQQEQKIEAVFFNYDYTPFSKHRDLALKNICEELQIKFFPAHDLMLNEPGKVLKDNGEPYSVYTYYRKKAEQLPVKRPATLFAKNFSNTFLTGANLDLLDKLLPNDNSNLIANGGRVEGVQILSDLPSHEAYQQERDFPAIHSSTKLSAHLKFGTVSVREVYRRLVAIHPQHLLITQLNWRDFFTQISFFYPEVYGNAFQKKFRQVDWSYSKENFARWCDGNTGFPIVDAGMRELNKTGYMHNRVRMIVASFLTKNLQIDWRWGEKYFATKLTDYDPALNNGNWQWAASTGCDAQPYFRIFNAWTQQTRFDLQAEYIKKWVPELAPLAPKQIHQEAFMETQILAKYPRPIVNHSETRELALAMFKKAAIS